MKEVKELYNKFDDVYIIDKSDEFNTELIEILELRNLIENAYVTIASADYRKESRGAHSHEKYTERDDKNWLKHTIAKLSNDKVNLSKRDVIMDTLNDEVNSIPLAKRVY